MEQLLDALKDHERMNTLYDLLRLEHHIHVDPPHWSNGGRWHIRQFNGGEGSDLVMERYFSTFADTMRFVLLLIADGKTKPKRTTCMDCGKPLSTWTELKLGMCFDCQATLRQEVIKEMEREKLVHDPSEVVDPTLEGADEYEEE